MSCSSCAQRRQLLAQAAKSLSKGQIKPAAAKLQETARSLGKSITAWRKPR